MNGVVYSIVKVLFSNLIALDRLLLDLSGHLHVDAQLEQETLRFLHRYSPANYLRLLPFYNLLGKQLKLVSLLQN